VQTCQVNRGNNTVAMLVTTPMQREGKEVSAIRTTMPAQRGRNNARAMLVMVPAQWGQQHHCDNGKDACALMMVMTPSWWGRQHQLEVGNNAIAARGTTILQQWQRCLGCKDACALTMATPLQWGQPQLDDSKDAYALMMVTTPLSWGQQHQLNDYTSLTKAEMPSQQEQQSALQWQQRCLRINSNNAIATRATTPLWWPQGYLHINDDKDAIATRVMTPAWGWQQCHRKEENNTVADQGQQGHWYKGSNASSTTERTLAHWQWQQHHCHKGNNRNCDNGKDAWTSTAMAPSQKGQQHQLDDKRWGKQR
jgi:hypothetical protein